MRFEKIQFLRYGVLGVLSFTLFLLFPYTTYARTTTYIGNYEITEESGIKKEVVRVAGTMGVHIHNNRYTKQYQTRTI